jgi:hypothetical protein
VVFALSRHECGNQNEKQICAEEITQYSAAKCGLGKSIVASVPDHIDASVVEGRSARHLKTPALIDVASLLAWLVPTSSHSLGLAGHLCIHVHLLDILHLTLQGLDCLVHFCFHASVLVPSTLFGQTRFVNYG